MQMMIAKIITGLFFWKGVYVKMENAARYFSQILAITIHCGGDEVSKV